MRSLGIVSILALFSFGCGDDGDGRKVSAEVAAICTTQCQKADECGLLEGGGLSPSKCRSVCEEVNSELTKDCMFTSAEAGACGNAYEAQTCDEITDAVVPSSCVKTCMVTVNQ